MDGITVEQLLDLCAYGTHINIKLSDTGKIVINGVNAMKYSKGKRQKAKWEAFRNKMVYGISPCAQIADLKRRSDVVILDIEAYMHRLQYDLAMKEYEESMSGKQ